MPPSTYDSRSPDAPRSDEALMRRVADNDMVAFAELARRYQQPLYRFACRMLGDAADAEDMVQETLLRIYQARTRFRPDATFKPWAFRIAANQCRDRLRWRRRRREAPLEAAAGRASGLADPVAEAATHELEDRLAQAIAALPEKHRAVFLMARYEDMPYEDVANALGIPVGTVKSRMNKAVRLLLAALETPETAP